VKTNYSLPKYKGRTGKRQKYLFQEGIKPKTKGIQDPKESQNPTKQATLNE
jgi:hypothetical protein